MHRIPTSVVVAAVFSVATRSAMPGRAQAAGASVEEQIKKIEKDRAAAVVKGDAAPVASQTSDDYTFINAYGQVTGKTQTINGASAPEDPSSASGGPVLTLARPKLLSPLHTGPSFSIRAGLPRRLVEGARG